jgi:hypothetical protein
MSNNIQTNHKDSFNEAVRSKLHDFEMPVDDALWDGIQSAMVTPAKRRPVFMWLSGIAASVAVLLTISLVYFTDFSTDNIAHVQQPSTEKNDVNPVKNQQMPVKQDVNAVIDVKKVIESQIPEDIDKSLAETVLTPGTQMEIQNAVENNIQSKKNMAGEISEKESTVLKDSSALKQTKLPTLESPVPEWEDPKKEKRKQGITLLALAGSAPGNSGNQSPLNAVSVVGKPRMGVKAAETATTYIFPAEFYESVDYKTPVSAGLGIAIPVVKHLSFETGINYTFLQTQYNANLIDAQMNLHYIGIPCRISYSFVDRPDWSLYSAVGATLEKGIWSNYVQNQHFTNSVITTTISKPIDGLQWSVQLSVGAAINLNDNLAAYAEPKLGYYFADNQPTSIRTNTPLNIGVEAGIRWRLGN